MPRKDLLIVLLAPCILLLVPLGAMQLTDEVNWGPLDFFVAWVLLAGTGLAYQLFVRQAGGWAYRLGAALAVLTALMIVWANLAVGMIGDEGNPVNLLYGGVLVLGAAGTLAVRREAPRMVRVLLGTALAQLLVPVIALAICPEEVTWLVCSLNAVFALMFAASALLFRLAARPLVRA